MEFMRSLLLMMVLTGWFVTSCAEPSNTIVPAVSHTVPKQYFGMHFFYTAADMRWPGEKPTLLPESVGSWRLWDAYGTEWRYLEPEKGVWQFGYLDRYVAQAQAKGVDLLLTLGQTPRWASVRPNEPTSSGFGNAAEPLDMKDWTDYVRSVATRYSGKIKYYEIWNEPKFSEIERPLNEKGLAGFYSGTASKMVEMTRIAAQVIHEIDPQAKVVSPSIVGHYQGLKRLEAFLNAGGGDAVDIVGFHFYFVDTISPEALPPFVQRVRLVMARHGIAQKSLWNTESGLIIQGPNRTLVAPLEEGGKGVLGVVLNDKIAGDLVARYLILGASSGLERYFWFAWDSGSMGFLNGPKPRTLNKAATAYATTSRWLAGAKLGPCTGDAGGVWRCDLTNSDTGDQALLIWTTQGRRNLALGSGWKLNNFEGLYGEQGVLDISSGNAVVDLTGAPLLLKTTDKPWFPGQVK